MVESRRVLRLSIYFVIVSEVSMAKQTAKTSDTKTSQSRDKQNKHLSDAELDTYKNRLIALRSRIRSDVSTMTDGALSHCRSEAAGDLSAMPLHMADIGSDNFEQEQTLSFIQTDQITLQLIEYALARIKSGTYGTCEICGKPIPKVRLNVLPYAANCIHCVEIAAER
jgi:RNA polymerase-binding transcription factor DksA